MHLISLNVKFGLVRRPNHAGNARWPPQGPDRRRTTARPGVHSLRLTPRSQRQHWVHDLDLVTRNVRHYENLGIEIVNPWEG